MADQSSCAHYALADRYTRTAGRVFLTGTQALVRIALDQARRDRAAGLRTAGFVSGYRGSPLGGVDQEMWRAEALLAQHRIEFLPAVNEDLAATAVLGSQQVESDPRREVEGVFALWYGKGPGVDRAGDALKHGNAYGSSPLGGVLVVAGDDHGCVSSSMPHQSDVAFMSWFMPTLNPASVAEYLSFGAYGYALSRFSGMWVGFKAVSETVESAASVELTAPRQFNTPPFDAPRGGLHYRWLDLPGPQIEERMEAKKHAVYAFARVNPIDQAVYANPRATYGIVTTGKGHLDLLEALRLLGLDEAACRRIGIDIYKVGMVWPLPRHDALEFVRGKREILVVEEKRGIIEGQFKEYFYDFPGQKPERMVGKHDEHGNRLIPWTGELSPRQLVPIVAQRLDAIFPGLDLVSRARALRPDDGRIIHAEGTARTPYFCSGCPHNTSTKVPEGSEALAGIGCHVMAIWMDRNTRSLIQMGGEGVNWAAFSRFAGRGHVFQNLGDGTYYHSGSMAIRQAIAAGANVTYKILFNSAVAMTGGQQVDGPLTVEAIAHAVRAEGVARIAVVSDEPSKFRLKSFPAGVTLHHRRDLDAVQRELREVKGVSVLVYEQMCATEKRRRRKRGVLPKPQVHAVINDLVCEGCGDCSVESNCLSVEPVETPFGRKRRINPSTCNTDLSCLDGFCPSFVTVHGTRRSRKPAKPVDARAEAGQLVAPAAHNLNEPFNLLVAGVGGTGVITLGQLVTMAAHLEGKGASVLDFTGFAQKFGPVLSYIRLAASPSAINQVRIDQGAADALIACDGVVGASPKASGTYRRGMRAVVNTAEIPTGDLVRRRDAALDIGSRLAAIARVAGEANVQALDANKAAEALLRDAVFANVMLLGMAWQSGLVPVSLAALARAIDLNGLAADANHEAFAWGRLAAARPAMVAEAMGGVGRKAETLDELIAGRVAFLTDYQDAAYAARYLRTVDAVRSAEAPFGSTALSETVARALFKLMAVKDEYEVARLHTQSGFLERLSEQFEPGFKAYYHLAPPLLPLGRDARGRPRKVRLGAWVQGPLGILARLKGLRGTWLDPFRFSAERRVERELIERYERLVGDLIAMLPCAGVAAVLPIATAPLDVRGYGPVKDGAMREVRARIEAGLTQLRNGAGSEARYRRAS
ncbi:MAG: indolepyruvate ferredoxin oxidoreductase family protein [Hyphomicrobiaceae bacterium]|nr:MAG: indolepyruvate ferredoxin oxidoreductase family protein [Hyphomicrobiaceae bacterium]